MKQVWCLKCKEDVNYTAWSDHCDRRHNEQNKDGDGKDDGKGDAKPKDGKPKDGKGKKEAKAAAPGRRQKALSGDKGTQKTKKASVAPKEK